MNTVKSIAIIALLLSGTSLAMAQNGPPTGGQPPAQQSVKLDILKLLHRIS